MKKFNNRNILLCLFIIIALIGCDNKTADTNNDYKNVEDTLNTEINHNDDIYPGTVLYTETVELPVSTEEYETYRFQTTDERISLFYDFYCGDILNYMNLPDIGNFRVILIDNQCGDYPYTSIVVHNDSSIIDHKIVQDYWINPENDSEITFKSFVIDKDYNIVITENILKDNKETQEISKIKINRDSGRIL